MNILVTGSTGMIGRALIVQLAHNPCITVRAALRQDTTCLPSHVEKMITGDLLSDVTKWKEALKGIDVVIHAAARVHQMRDHAEDPFKEFSYVNTEGTRQLAECAALSGVKRFIFLSSIKVNGEETKAGCPFTAHDTPTPQDPYGVSKWRAEQIIADIAHKNTMTYTIIRPPLVYGPGVKGNFASLMRWMKKGIPLPLGAIHHNRRSFVALDNLIHLIMTCIDHPRAMNETFLVSDNEDLSTTDLLQRTAHALKVRAHLIPLHPLFLQGIAYIAKKDTLYQKLCGSLQVDMTKTQHSIGWSPPLTVNEGLHRAALHSLLS